MDELTRDERLKNLERLWKEKTGKPLSALDQAINKRFEVSDGRDSLGFWAMQKVEDALNNMQ